MSIPALHPGQRVRFATPAPEARYWWDVRTGDERYTILTRQAPFHPKGERAYTIIDRKRGVRGPCNRIGQGWDLHMGDEACAALLRALQAHDEAPGRIGAVEVSYRNNVPVVIQDQGE